MSDFPTPKYRKGQKVWMYYTETYAKTWDCPDCLGQKTWEVRSPAGGVFTVDCIRCTGGSMQTSVDLPSLKYTAYRSWVRPMTIGSIRIDTESTREPVEYMCVETGVGSGSIWSESKLFATEEEAEAAGKVAATLEETARHASPEHINNRHIGTAHFRSAQMKVYWESIWRCWYHFRQFRDDLKDSGVDLPSSGDNYQLEEFLRSLSAQLGDAAEAKDYARVVELLKNAEASP